MHPHSGGDPGAVAGVVRERPGSRWAGALLWALQVPLACVFLFAGGAKLAAPVAALTAQTAVPAPVLRGVAALEILGAAGLLLPGLLRRHVALTPLAAAGLLLLMAGATGATLAGHDSQAVVAPIATGALLFVVLAGRWRLTPHRELRAASRARERVGGDK